MATEAGTGEDRLNVLIKVEMGLDIGYVRASGWFLSATRQASYNRGEDGNRCNSPGKILNDGNKLIERRPVSAAQTFHLATVCASQL